MATSIGFERNADIIAEMSQKIKVVVILGPTASGKSALAVKIARKYNGEIISADSRQVYRGMDIGTGKISRDTVHSLWFTVYSNKKEPIKQKSINSKLETSHYYSNGIRHHLLDIASPKKQFTVDDFKRLGQKAIAGISKHGKLPIICGGTGLYIDSLLYDIAIPHIPPDKKLRIKLEKLTTRELFDKLLILDPERAKSIDRHNPRRLIRALEIVMTTGKPIPRLQFPVYGLPSKFDVLWVGINPGKEKLVLNIEKRLDSRLKAGMINEVKKLHKSGINWRHLESFGLEYKWLAMFLQKKITRREMREGLLHDIIRYSKRQMTWFKRNSSVHWIKFPAEAGRLTKKFLGN